MKEPHDPGRSVAPMTATDLGLRKTFNISGLATIFPFSLKNKDRIDETMDQDLKRLLIVHGHFPSPAATATVPSRIKARSLIFFDGNQLLKLGLVQDD
jgi:hypothetical protein